MGNIPEKILKNVEETIEKYSLFEGEKICVAYSGGKDSLFLCLILRELGYQVYPIIIDIGYNSDWSIALENIRQIDITDGVLIGLEEVNHIMPEIMAELEENLENIKKVRRGCFKKATICTPCHNSKMLILQRWAEINNVHFIANGHHAIDAVSSLLKSFYMYIDRWEYHHEEFVYENFYKLIFSQKNLYSCEKDEFQKLFLYNEIIKQIYAQNVGTDEPIVQYLGNTSIRMCRPLFGVLENEIIDYFENQNIKTFNESECFVTNFRDKEMLTPRELIQYELLKNAPCSLLVCLLELAKMNLDEEGFLKFNVRNNRTKILGNIYKDESINIIKK